MKIKQLAEKYNNYIIEKRRWFHQYPELSLKEEKTTNVIVAELEGMGLPVTRFDGLCGCYADLKTGKPGPTVMLRADIDALPQVEQTGLPFSSKNEGVMHACGHDTHAAMLLGSAKILCEMKEELRGTVRFFFQSGEEMAGIGALMSMEKGVLKGVDAIFGMHVWNAMDSGKYNMEMGPRMCGAGHFTLTIRGVSAHGSAPNAGKDAIAAAMAVYTNLYAMTCHTIDPQETVVLSLNVINGGQRWNIIADEVKMEGSARIFNQELLDSIPQRILDVAQPTAAAYGCTAEMEYKVLSPSVYNKEPQLVQLAQKAAVSLYGEEVLSPFEKLMGGEDFSYLMNAIPGVFGFLGGHNPNVPGTDKNNHNVEFTVDEGALHRGAAINAQCAFDFLTVE